MKSIVHILCNDNFTKPYSKASGINQLFNKMQNLNYYVVGTSSGKKELNGTCWREWMRAKDVVGEQGVWIFGQNGTTQRGVATLFYSFRFH